MQYEIKLAADLFYKKSTSCEVLFWPAQRDLNPRSSESESAALSSCAMGSCFKKEVRVNSEDVVRL